MFTDSGIWRRTCVRALHVDVEQQIIAVLFRIGERVAGRAIEIPEDIGRLQKLIRLPHALEGGAIDVVIFAALLFRAARLGAWCS